MVKHGCEKKRDGKGQFGEEMLGEGRDEHRSEEICRAKEPRRGALPSKGLAQPGGETLLRDAKEGDRRGPQRCAEKRRGTAEERGELQGNSFAWICGDSKRGLN